MPTDSTACGKEAASLRCAPVGRVMSVRGWIAICLLIAAATVGAIRVSAFLAIQHTKALLYAAMDDARSNSAALRDAAGAVARMHAAELHRQHAADPAQGALFARQASTNYDTLRARLRGIADRTRSVQAAQTLEHLKDALAALADYLRSPRVPGVAFADRIGSERHTNYVEMHF